MKELKIERQAADGLAGLGERFYRLRIENRLEIREAAELLDVSDNAISTWETGRSLPSLRYILPICDLFGVAPEWLLEGRGRRAKRRASNG